MILIVIFYYLKFIMPVYESFKMKDKMVIFITVSEDNTPWLADCDLSESSRETFYKLTNYHETPKLNLIHLIREL